MKFSSLENAEQAITAQLVPLFYTVFKPSIGVPTVQGTRGTFPIFWVTFKPTDDVILSLGLSLPLQYVRSDRTIVEEYTIDRCRIGFSTQYSQSNPNIELVGDESAEQIMNGIKNTLHNYIKMHVNAAMTAPYHLKQNRITQIDERKKILSHLKILKGLLL